jgi:uncharacterized BrkB/YihY/UPF0761 family membrane protein
VADPSVPSPPPGPASGPVPEPEPASAEARTSRTARARAQAEHLKTRADQTVKQIEAKRPSSRVVDAAFATMERDVTSGGGVLAAALAFRIFIFLVPFVFVVVTAIPAASDAADADPQELADKFGMAGLASTAIHSASDMSFWNRLTLLAVGIFALVLASRSLVRVLRITHGLAWSARVPKLQKPTRAALVLILVVFLLVFFSAITSSMDIGVLGVIPAVLSCLVFVALWVFVQDHLPHHPDVTWRDQLPGAVLVALGTEGLGLVTVLWFTRSIESKSETYGAIGAALAMLLWAYFLGRILVSGAMLNAVLWEQKERDVARKAAARGTRPSAPPRPQEHGNSRNQDRDDHGLDVERDVAVVREEQQDRPAQDHRGQDAEEHPPGEGRHGADPGPVHGAGW